MTHNKIFSPHLEILPSPQRRLWDELSTTPSEFVLYGGTAVALHLGHRDSIDFDFFGNKKIDGQQLLSTIPYLARAVVTQMEPNTLSCSVDRNGGVKLSFFGVPSLTRLRQPLVAPDNGLQIASLLDLAATKVSVVQRRAEAKDYIDIAAIVSKGGVSLPQALAAGKAVFKSQFNPIDTLKALSYFNDGDLQSVPKNVRDFLASEVAAVDLGHLPVVVFNDKATSRIGMKP